jgi:two-component system CheB/CheR fusion protein
MPDDVPKKPRAGPGFAGPDVQGQHSAVTPSFQHQVRNLLAVVRSIARRTAETSQSVEEYAMKFDGRLSAYARTLAMLARNPEDGVELEYMLAEELLAAQAHDGEQVGISGPSMRLQPKAAETMGLVMHELATNAIRHGALGQAGGRVSVAWRIDKDASGGALVFDWVESPGRKLMALPTRRGFGVEMLEETLPFELNARSELHFESTGFRCRISLPLNAQVFILPPGA